MLDSFATIEMYFTFFAWSLNTISRSSLPEITEDICEFLESYKGPQEEMHAALKRIIVRVLATHRMYFVRRGRRKCKNDIVHSSVLALARIAFRSSFPDSILVSRILADIYCCEKDFRSILVGAFNEPYKCRWYLLYKDRYEGVRALDYYLYHTNVVKKVFFSDGVPTRFGDLSLHIPHFYHPAVYAYHTNRFDTFIVLAAYGANLRDTRKPPFSYSVESKVFCHSDYTPERTEFRRLFLLAHPELEFPMPSLQQLARQAIRQQLWKNFQLPWGIYELPLPYCMMEYLDLHFNYFPEYFPWE